MLNQIAPGVTLDGDVPGRRNMIRGDGIAEGHQHTRTADVLQWFRLRRKISKKRRLSEIGRVWFPSKGCTRRGLHVLPLLVPLVDRGVFTSKHVLADGCLHSVLYLHRGRPEISEEDWLSVSRISDRFGCPVRDAQTGEPIATDLDEPVHHIVLAQQLCQGQDEVCGARSRRQGIVEADTYYDRRRNGEWLTEQAGLGLNASHSPAHTPSPLTMVVWESVPTSISGIASTRPPVCCT